MALPSSQKDQPGRLASAALISAASSLVDGGGPDVPQRESTASDTSDGAVNAGGRASRKSVTWSAEKQEVGWSGDDHDDGNYDDNNDSDDEYDVLALVGR